MKKLLLFKKIIIVILLAGVSSAGWTQVILYEDFNYATPAFIGGNGDAGSSSNNWITHSVVAGHTTTINIEDASLTYTGIANSSGNKVDFFSNANATDRDVNRAITSAATTLYYSALINIRDNSQITVTGDYFMSFGATSGTSVTSLAARLGLKSVNGGTNFRFMILNNSGGTTPPYTDNGADLDFGTTYLVVVKYDKSTIPTTANLWVNPTSLGGTEPTGSVTNSSGTGTFTTFASVCLRNNAASPKAYIDEIRVGETWADVTPAGVATPTITIISPATGAQWAQGSNQDYIWTASGTNANVKIEFTADASATTPTWYEINPSIAANTGTWTSTIPADLPIGNDYQIRITDIPQTTVGLSGIFSVIAAPAPVATFDPANAATDIDITKDITITFDVPVRNIDNSDITEANVASLLTLTTTDALGTPVPFTATIDATKKVITINPVSDLAFEQLYYVAINPVEGLGDNATVAQNITFTTAASVVHTISDVAITEVMPYDAGQTVTITWASSNVTDVQIEAWIPSQSKWEIIIPTTPSDGTVTFQIPADAQYSTDYKLRISDVSNAAVTAEGSTFTIIAVVDNLLDLRAQPVDAIVKYTGIATVTFAQASRNQKYIQDATAAVLIDDPNPGFIGTYNVGEGITNVVGKILLYNALIEFTPIAATGEHATGMVIVPEVRTLESLTPADQCKLVTIEDFAFKTPTQFDANGLFVKSKNYDIDGYDNTLMAYRTAFTLADYIGGSVPVGPISSIALVGQFNSQMQITARSWSDMTVPTVADFMADQTFVLTGENVNFMDMSSNHPTSWEWTFEGGTPATSTDQNPVVTYSAKGTYAVTLKAIHPSGGTNTITKTDYISIGVVGISTLQSTVKVYPNPTNDFVYITNPTRDAQEIVIYNAVGKQVSSILSAKDVISLSIASQSKGMYLVRITNKATKLVQFKKVVLY